MELTPERIRELLDYDPDTGILTWRVRSVRPDFRQKDEAWNTRYAGKSAGMTTQRGYVWVHVTPAFAKPMRIKVALEAAAGTVTEIEVRLSKNDIGNGTSTAASLGPVSTRTDSGYTAACIPRHLATGDTTAETTPVTLWRSSYPFAQATAEGNDPLGFEITREMLGNPVMDENSSLIVFISATTTQATGFVVFQWAEVPVNDLS